MAIQIDEAGHDLQLKARAAEEQGHLDGGSDTTIHCPCGYTGEPGAVIRYSEWDAADYDYDLCICPSCGDA